MEEYGERVFENPDVIPQNLKTIALSGIEAVLGQVARLIKYADVCVKRMYDGI